MSCDCCLNSRPPIEKSLNVRRNRLKLLQWLTWAHRILSVYHTNDVVTKGSKASCLFTRSRSYQIGLSWCQATGLKKSDTKIQQTRILFHWISNKTLVCCGHLVCMHLNTVYKPFAWLMRVLFIVCKRIGISVRLHNALHSSFNCFKWGHFSKWPHLSFFERMLHSLYPADCCLLWYPVKESNTCRR